jgi:hypothetical protein
VSASTIILIVVILVIVAVVAAVVSMRARRKTAERQQFGPEYDRLADEVGPAKANAEFGRRRQRVDGLGIKSITAERRTAYIGQWDAVQEQFIDSPVRAVKAAGDLITAVAADRGYETAKRDQLLTDLSVYHGRHLDGYRHSYEVIGQAREASTEDLRQALLDYRHLFFDLLEYDSTESSDDARPLDSQVDARIANTPGTSSVPGQTPWKQVTQGLHWKSRQQDDSGVPASRP